MQRFTHGFLSKIPHDKLLHSFYGTLTYIIISFFSHDVAMLLVTILAVSKEVLDEKKNMVVLIGKIL